VALEATLESYLRGEPTEIPVLAAIARPAEDVAARAERWASALRLRGVEAHVVSSTVEMGGGALADKQLASFAIAIPDRGDLADALRRGEPAVVGRLDEGALLLDARTVLDDEDDLLVQAVARAKAVPA
jgi:L-seryl-tRNA(Ser) seleniumtransferase